MAERVEKIEAKLELPESGNPEHRQEQPSGLGGEDQFVLKADRSTQVCVGYNPEFCTKHNREVGNRDVVHNAQEKHYDPS